MIRTISGTLCTCVALAAGVGCQSAREAQLSKDNPSCRSVVELSLVCDTSYSSRPPLLILKRPMYSDESRFLHGAIVATSDSGVVFRRSLEGSRTTTSDQFIPHLLMECLVDENNQIVYGTWNGSPEVEWEVRLVCKRVGDTVSSPFSLLLEPNVTSSYCLAPGKYSIESIEFSSSDLYLHRSQPLMDCTFSVFPDVINFLGRLQTEYRWRPSKGMAVVPTFVVNHRGMGSISTIPVQNHFGWLGVLALGVAGTLVDSDIRHRANAGTPFHALRVVDDPGFRPVFQGRLPVRFAPMSLH